MSYVKNSFRNALICICSKVNFIISRNNGDRIIALHDVPDIHAFREKIIWLQQNYSLVSMDVMLTSKPPNSKKRIVLTFDDGYENWLTNVAPVLEEFNIPAIFFVNSGLFNLGDKDENDFLKNNLLRKKSIKLISTDSFLKLSRNPLFEIGGHSHSHLNLANIKDGEELNREIGGDKLRLEQLIGKRIRWFAYPFGGANYFNSSVSEVVRLCGYLAAFSIIPSNFMVDSNRYEYGRDCLELSDPHNVWKWRLSGGYDALFSWK
jgi:peptidoglycan/xylan/chitin deacetylase (PgdA/CDA1 family)